MLDLELMIKDNGINDTSYEKVSFSQNPQENLVIITANILQFSSDLILNL